MDGFNWNYDSLKKFDATGKRFYLEYEALAEGYLYIRLKKFNLIHSLAHSTYYVIHAMQSYVFATCCKHPLLKGQETRLMGRLETKEYCSFIPFSPKQSSNRSQRTTYQPPKPARRMEVDPKGICSRHSTRFPDILLGSEKNTQKNPDKRSSARCKKY